MTSADSLSRTASAAVSAPLTSAQEAIWFFNQRGEATPAYVFQALFRMRGALNRRALQSALDEIMRRHSIFRTTFSSVDGVPRQIVHDAVPATVGFRSLIGKACGEVDKAVVEALQDVVKRPFDLNLSPLIRWQLLELDEMNHILVHTEHHLVHDGWSFAIVAEELAALYDLAATGVPNDLEEPSLQFEEYAAWEAMYRQRRDATGLEYWLSALDGCPQGIGLAFDYPRPAISQFRGASHELHLDASFDRMLREASRDMNVSLFTFMLGAFAFLLHRYSDDSDLPIGSAFANRSHPGVERLVGMLVNTVVLRIGLQSDSTVRDYMADVQNVVLDALECEDVPFSAVVQGLGVERSLAVNPLFQVLFSFHDAPLRRRDSDTLTIEVTEGVNCGFAKVDLDLVVIPSLTRRVLGPPIEDSGGLRLIWEYSTELFEDETIAQMSAHYEHVLRECSLRPDVHLSKIGLADTSVAARVERLDVAFRKSAPPSSVVALFEAQVTRSPASVALVHGTSEITYAELDARASELACRLRAQGIAEESLVGICLQRSPEFVIALLGVLKSGGAYVPIDPSYPEERQRALAKGTGLAAIIEARHAFADTGLLGLEIGALEMRAALGPRSWPIDERQLAYVIYTSGSTGTPRGVAVEHRSLLNFVVATANDWKVCESDRVLNVAGVAFDRHVEEILPALVRGATLVIGGELDVPSVFLRGVARDEITVLDLPTAYWRELTFALERRSVDLPGCVRLVAIGGEAAPSDAVSRWRNCIRRPVTLLNGYGPTEATVTATEADLTVDKSGVSKGVSIGRPKANVEAYVVDSSLHLQPAGVPGELLLGGLCLARGYLAEPSSTAEHFVPDPFSGASGARLYRSGDRVRLRRDGALEFLGRRDGQIKLRGFRVELAEIESAIRTYPGIRDAVVRPFGDEPARRLVAYFVHERDVAIPHSGLRAFLARTLPGFMIPTAFIELERLPAGATGKIDLRALPQVSDAAAPTRESPESAVERLLCEVWADVLGSSVGVEDNFFDLGGNSILSMRVVAKAADRGVDLSLHDLFRFPTIRSLAAVLQLPSRSADDARVPA